MTPQLKTAFDTTRPHLMDSGIRFTEDPANLSILTLPETKAVILQSDNDELQKSVLNYFEPNGCPAIKVTSILDIPSYEEALNEPIDSSKWEVDLPLALREDIKRTCLRLKTHLPVNDRMKVRHLLLQHGYKNNEGIDRSNSLHSGHSPHIDGNTFKLGIIFRFLKSYAISEDMTTEYYPGNYSFNDNQSVKERFKASADKSSFKKDLKRNYAGTTSLIGMKGAHLNYIPPQEETLLHSAPAKIGSRIVHAVTFHP